MTLKKPPEFKDPNTQIAAAAASSTIQGLNTTIHLINGLDNKEEAFELAAALDALVRKTLHEWEQKPGFEGLAKKAIALEERLVAEEGKSANDAPDPNQPKYKCDCRPPHMVNSTDTPTL